MPRPTALDAAACQAALASLPGWQLDATRGAIRRSFRFADFGQAFSFMTALALHAERHDHHPEWFNVYGRVVVDLVTHDAAGVTERDLRLARAMEALALGREKT